MFGIKATTVRKLIPVRYQRNMQALYQLLDDANARGIPVLCYIAPLRPEVAAPYDAREYSDWKNLVANFNWPYLARSPRDFWKRWHSTLSSWIRDYLYLPLWGLAYRDRSEGGLEIATPRSSHTLRITLALFATWFIMGLWHGASWRFAF